LRVGFRGIRFRWCQTALGFELARRFGALATSLASRSFARNFAILPIRA